MTDSSRSADFMARRSICFDVTPADWLSLHRTEIAAAIAAVLSIEIPFTEVRVTRNLLLVYVAKDNITAAWMAATQSNMDGEIAKATKKARDDLTLADVGLG